MFETWYTIARSINPIDRAYDRPVYVIFDEWYRLCDGPWLRGNVRDFIRGNEAFCRWWAGGGATKFGRSNKKSPNRNCRRQPNNSFPSKRHFRNRSTRSDIHSINETGFQLIRIDPCYRDRFTWNRAIFVNVRGLKCLLNLWRRRRGETFDNGLLWN